MPLCVFVMAGDSFLLVDEVSVLRVWFFGADLLLSSRLVWATGFSTISSLEGSLQLSKIPPRKEPPRSFCASCGYSSGSFLEEVGGFFISEGLTSTAKLLEPYFFIAVGSLITCVFLRERWSDDSVVAPWSRGLTLLFLRTDFSRFILFFRASYSFFSL